MKTVALSTPTFGFVVATRAALGVGIGLLVSSKIPDSPRRTIGATLVTLGVLSTIPAAVAVLRQRRRVATP
jgi:hypothetical protein